MTDQRRDAVNIRQGIPHGQAITPAIDLGAGSVNCWAFRPVEDARLETSGIGHAAHEPAEGLDLRHKMTLADSAYRGIARQGAGIICIEREQGSARTSPSGGRRSFASGVAGADHKNIPTTHAASLQRWPSMFHVKQHRYFPMQNRLKI
ncbi:hypothetical protein GCM10007973_17610 [Polymorphobacter multimanifer]|uniref:Uncharacterized protein n=1 Tax=Polymorphobacter multimanifer TaxID=1070431 RepID=A0A841LE04_9SPHN|nr:hypothetical protein [Polymorphobacter multimanifer]GGI81675.1 hypothetical protein GCM10007973_17610 [Polymorphobacter multimanifer]